MHRHLPSFNRIRTTVQEIQLLKAGGVVRTVEGVDGNDSTTTSSTPPRNASTTSTTEAGSQPPSNLNTMPVWSVVAIAATCVIATMVAFALGLWSLQRKTQEELLIWAKSTHIHTQHGANIPPERLDPSSVQRSKACSQGMRTGGEPGHNGGSLPLSRRPVSSHRGIFLASQPTGVPLSDTSGSGALTPPSQCAPSTAQDWSITGTQSLPPTHPYRHTTNP